MISSVRLNHRALRVAPLHREDYIFVCSSDLDISDPTPADAPALTLIDIEAHCPLFRYFLDALPSGEPWHFSDLELMGTIGAVRARVLEGVGVAVLPLYFVDRDLAAGRLRKLRSEVTLHHDFFRLIWHEEQVQPQLLQTLAGELRMIPLA